MFPLAGPDPFPVLPREGIGSVAEGASLPGSTVVHLAFAHNGAVPGPSPGSYAYTKTVAHRNLFWISLK